MSWTFASGVRARRGRRNHCERSLPPTCRSRWGPEVCRPRATRQAARRWTPWWPAGAHGERCPTRPRGRRRWTTISSWWRVDSGARPSNLRSDGVARRSSRWGPSDSWRTSRASQRSAPPWCRSSNCRCPPRSGRWRWQRSPRIRTTKVRRGFQGARSLRSRCVPSVGCLGTSGSRSSWPWQGFLESSWFESWASRTRRDGLAESSGLRCPYPRNPTP
jgi:hypothetical protein